MSTGMAFFYGTFVGVITGMILGAVLTRYA